MYRFNEGSGIIHPTVVLSNPSSLSDITVQVDDVMATATGEYTDFVSSL